LLFPYQSVGKGSFILKEKEMTNTVKVTCLSEDADGLIACQVLANAEAIDAKIVDSITASDELEFVICTPAYSDELAQKADHVLIVRSSSDIENAVATVRRCAWAYRRQTFEDLVERNRVRRQH
jgi:hypothetical protein